MGTAAQALFAALESPGALAVAEAELQRAMTAREIFFGDHLLPTYVTPFFVPERRLADWVARSEALAERIEEVARAALDDRALFDTLKLQPAAQSLLRIDPGYRRITALSRPDAIVDGDRLLFLEFNCDSPAMMAFADAVAACQLGLSAFAGVRARLRASDMTGALLATLTACWREFGGTASHPSIAITDWSGQKTRYEHRTLAAAFEAAGHPTVVCDPRAFRRREGRLEVEGHRVDVVYRRALFTELLERQEEVEPLLSAYRDGKVCMVNSLRSYLASSKTLLAVLCDRYGTPEVARTAVLAPPEIDRLRRGPRDRVVKRGESHGGHHVLLPGLASDEAWTRALDAAGSEAWVVQDFHRVPQLTVLERTQDGTKRADKFFNWNPFLFGGRHAGSIARASDTPLINITLGGGLLPTFIEAE